MRGSPLVPGSSRHMVFPDSHTQNKQRRGGWRGGEGLQVERAARAEEDSWISLCFYPLVFGLPFIAVSSHLCRTKCCVPCSQLTTMHLHPAAACCMRGGPSTMQQEGTHKPSPLVQFLSPPCCPSLSFRMVRSPSHLLSSRPSGTTSLQTTPSVSGSEPADPPTLSRRATRETRIRREAGAQDGDLRGRHGREVLRRHG